MRYGVWGMGVWGWIVEYEARDSEYAMRGILSFRKEKCYGLRAMRYSSGILNQLGDAQFSVW